MIIRTAKESDIDSIVKLLNELDESHDKLNLSSAEKKYIQRTVGYNKIIEIGLKKLLREKDKYIIIAEKDKRIIGYLSSKIDKRSSTKLYNKKLYIKHLIVSKEYRDMGIGTKMIKKAEKFANRNKVNFIALKTSPRNLSSIKFYKNLKFQEMYIEMIKAIK